MLPISTSSSANGLAADPFATVAAATPDRTYRIGFALDDLLLENALRKLLPSRPELREGLDNVAVTITDRDPDDGFATGRVLRVGADRGAPGQQVLPTLEPRLILSAAALMAAGYRLERERRPADEDAPQHLSQRERQVASLLVEGASNKLIARELGISVHTAKFHVTAVMDKLGARNRSDAVAIALREGFVTL